MNAPTRGDVMSGSAHVVDTPSLPSGYRPPSAALVQPSSSRSRPPGSVGLCEAIVDGKLISPRDSNGTYGDEGQCGAGAMWGLPEYPMCRSHRSQIPPELVKIAEQRIHAWNERAAALWEQILAEFPTPTAGGRP